jgi:hypothetical protein
LLAILSFVGAGECGGKQRVTVPVPPVATAGTGAGAATTPVPLGFQRSATPLVRLRYVKRLARRNQVLLCGEIHGSRDAVGNVLEGRR